MFSPAQEEAMVVDLEKRFSIAKRPLSSRSLSRVIVRYWASHQAEGRRTARLVVENRFRLGFMKRHSLSFRTPSIRRPAAFNLIQERAVEHYIQSIEAAARRLGNKRVLNMEETSWRDVQYRRRTIARRGARAVRVSVRGNVKAAMTAICTICRSGRKLPPLYIARAANPNCRPDLWPLINQECITVSENGWMTETVMMKYLGWIVEMIHEIPIALVLDTFPGHITAKVWARAEALRVELIEFPRGMTGELQPLDCSCFGPLKMMSQQLWNQETETYPGMTRTTRALVEKRTEERRGRGILRVIRRTSCFMKNRGAERASRHLMRGGQLRQ
jgi:hypothetical protein